MSFSINKIQGRCRPGTRGHGRTWAGSEGQNYFPGEAQDMTYATVAHS